MCFEGIVGEFVYVGLMGDELHGYLVRLSISHKLPISALFFLLG